MIGRVLGYIDKFLTFVESWTLFVAVMVGLVSLFANVILRYQFNYALAWSEELIREIIILTTFIGCSAAVRNRNMITIDALPQIVTWLRLPLNYLSHGATMLFSVIIVRLGWQVALQQMATHQKTIILQIPLVILYTILPIMGTMMFLRTLFVVHEDIRRDFLTARRS